MTHPMPPPRLTRGEYLKGLCKAARDSYEEPQGMRAEARDRQEYAAYREAGGSEYESLEQWREAI